MAEADADADVLLDMPFTPEPPAKRETCETCRQVTWTFLLNAKVKFLFCGTIVKVNHKILNRLRW